MRTFSAGALALLWFWACGGETSGPGGGGGGAASAGKGTGGTRDPRTGGPCKLNSDCDAPLVCIFGRCHEQCAAAVDCAAGQHCVGVDGGHVCQLAEESKCKFNSDCREPLVCAVDKECRTPCVADRDCVQGEVCATSKVCASPDLLDTSGDLRPP